MPHLEEVRGLTNPSASKTTLVDADEFQLRNSASGFALVKLTWANFKSALLAWASSALFTELNITGAGAAFRALNYKENGDAVTVYASVRFESSAGEMRHQVGFAAWGGFHTFYANGNLQLTINDTNATFTKPLIIPGGTLLRTSAALTNGAGAAAGTLGNAPAAGNPTKWIPINDNGTTRYIPAW